MYYLLKAKKRKERIENGMRESRMMKIRIPFHRHPPRLLPHRASYLQIEFNSYKNDFKIDKT